ncbi:MAG: serine hydrolase [Chloroflexaceae bacterium]|nr:serine hydrolase [Chloroflexaceae bacterium]
MKILGQKFGFVVLGIVLFLGLSGLPALANLELDSWPPDWKSLTPSDSPTRISVPTVPIAPSQTNRTGPSNLQEIEDFFDRLILQEMNEESVPGLAISLVKDGEILFAKGYGFANVAQNIRVDPERTLFE